MSAANGNSLDSLVVPLDSIICGDNATVMATWPDACIDLVVTSPPYDDLRKYGGHAWDFPAVARELTRILKPGGVIVWVVGDATVDGSETLTSMKQAIHFREVCGLNVHDTMIYKRETIPLTSNRCQPEWEYMLVLSKGKPNTFNPPLVPCNMGRPGLTCKKAQRGVDGVVKPRHTIATPKEMKVKSNVWEYNPRPGGHQDSAKWDHPATFPDALAADHILSWSNPGDVVLDPFAGSGTTLKMAKEHGRHYIGIEVNPAYVAICEKRVAQGVLPLVPNARLDRQEDAE